MMTSSNGNIFALLAICAGNSPVPGEFPAQRPVMRSFDFYSLICTRINGWVNNGEAGDLTRHRAHYDVIVMTSPDILAINRSLHAYTSPSICSKFTTAWWFLTAPELALKSINSNRNWTGGIGFIYTCLGYWCLTCQYFSHFSLPLYYFFVTYTYTILTLWNFNLFWRLKLQHFLALPLPLSYFLIATCTYKF